MSDDLDDLKAAMKTATPAPDAARRAENLALAQKNFERLQGSTSDARPTPVVAPSGLWAGIRTMLNSMTTKGGLTATTAIVACGFLFLTPSGQDMWRESDFAVTDNRTSSPAVMDTSETSTLQGAEPAKQSEAEIAAVPLAEDAEDAPAPVLTARTAPAPEGEATQTQAISALGEVVEGSIQASPTPQAPTASTTTSDFALSREVDGPSLTFGDTEPVNEDRHSGVDQYSYNSQPDINMEESFATDAFEAMLVPDTEQQGFLDAVPFRPSDTSDDLSAAPNTETFANETPSSLKITQETPISTFSIDVDTASYSVLRSSITRGQLPPSAAIRIEELINYFPYDYPAPDVGEAPFRPTVSTMQTPWNADTQLVHIAIQGQLPAVEDRPPLNLVFLIDTSGSMNDPAKLPLLKQSLQLMLSQLRPEDEVAIVEYAGSVGQVLAPTPASEQSTIINAINGLGAGGSTNGQGGLQRAYAVADQMTVDGEVSRVILATDGDFNVGINDPDALKDFIADKRETGTYLSVLGFGRGNLDDATMQALAQNGNGTAAYIDTLTEAQKVLVDQLTGALFPIAGDVKIQVEWNPSQIAEYRLIGYETRALAREDFNNDKVDAGELGAGHSVTALYEVTPVGSPAKLSDPLRYAPAAAATESEELGFLKLRYKAPGADVSQLLTSPIVPTDGAPADAKFAAAIAGFGQLLRDPRFLGEWGFDDAIALANANRGNDPFGYRSEAVRLMRLAQSLNRAAVPMRAIQHEDELGGTSIFR